MLPSPRWTVGVSNAGTASGLIARAIRTMSASMFGSLIVQIHSTPSRISGTRET